MNLQQHPLSAAFPAMSSSDLDALTEDIKQHGQREPGVLFENMVLDGWHRYLACEKVGVEFKSSKLNGEDPVAFVLSHNLHRRHLTASQRAACIVAATNWRPVGRPQENRAPGAQLSTKQLADKAEVSERTIKDAKVAHQAGLGEEVSSGRVSAKRAAAVAKLPKAKREKALKEPRAQKPKKPEGVSVAEVAKLEATIKELTEQKNDLADTARDLEDKLTAFETTEPDEQQKEIMKLQKRIVRLEAEIQRLTIARNDCQNKNNQLIRQVKMLQKGSR
jgi:hypothetical protein